MLAGTRKIQLTQRASVHLDMARGLAAFAVLLSHVRGLFFVPYHELSHHSIVISAFYASTSLGHQAVIVFFVLSGFFIASITIRSFDDGSWSWTVYLINRILRLSLVLIPALFLCLFLDRIGMTLSSTAAFYEHPVENLISSSVATVETVRNFVGSFFYVQGILAQPFGSDSPLWSLSYEFWYYILFPIAVCVLNRKLHPWLRAAYVAAAVFIVLFIGHNIALYFLIWLVGGAIALMLLRGKASLRTSWASTAAIVPLVCVLGVSIARPLDSAFLTDSVVALAFAMWMYAILEMSDRPVGAFYAKLARLMAGFSYTLYLTHFPFVFFIRANVHHVWRPDLLHLLYAAVIVASAMLIAYGVAQVTEAKTSFFRKKVLGLLQ
jgi:peptidoglycan/LPS O-acetylase OafA/YrhL